MSDPLPRETATHIEPRPHPFIQAGRVCGECGAAENDASHAVWADPQNAGREQASAPSFQRELGT